MCFSYVFIGSLVSRYRNKEAKDEESLVKHDRSARLGSAMQRLDFVTKTPEKQKEISEQYEE